MTKRRHLTRVRHFGAMMGTGDVFATDEKCIVEILGNGLAVNSLTLEDFNSRTKLALGTPFIQLLAHKAVFVNDEKVSKDDLECVYNDRECVNAAFGPGTYEKFCNAVELEILEKVLPLYALQLEATPQ